MYSLIYFCRPCRLISTMREKIIFKKLKLYLYQRLAAAKIPHLFKIYLYYGHSTWNGNCKIIGNYLTDILHDIY